MVLSSIRVLCNCLHACLFGALHDCAVMSVVDEPYTLVMALTGEMTKSFGPSEWGPRNRVGGRGRPARVKVLDAWRTSGTTQTSAGRMP